MSYERWGAFSVIDHKDAARLAPEVLLYDRLVFPVPASVKEAQRWQGRGWEPGQQHEFIGKLGSRAIKANWGYEDRNSAFHEWARQFSDLQEDVSDIVEEAKRSLGYELTRRALAQMKYPVPKGVDGIDVVTACQSEEDFRAGFQLNEASSAVADMGLSLSQRIAVPLAERDPRDGLNSALELSLDPEFLQKRTTVHYLQNKVLSATEPALETLQELEQRTEELIDFISLMVKKVRFTYAFAMVGVSPGSAVGRPFPSYKSRSTTLSAVQFKPRFARLDPRPGSPVVKAMYHD